MALTAAQICSLARADAKVPGYTAQSGQLLNLILGDLCETYNLAIAKGTYYFNFDPGLMSPVGNSIYGSGPYFLPADYLRAERNDVFWTLLGVSYFMTACDLSEFDAQVQQAGLQSYPYMYAVDLSYQDSTVEGGSGQPALFVYSPPSGTYPVTVRYQRQMPDIVTPETSADIPWFPNSGYLRRRLAGELCVQSGDDRADAFLGESPTGAQGILNRYLKLANDNQDRAQTISLDRRRFGRSFNRLKNTKVVGW